MFTVNQYIYTMKNIINLSNPRTSNFNYSKQNFIYILSFLILLLFSSNTIIGQENNNSAVNPSNAIQQSFVVKGTVYSKLDNAPLPGTGVILKNSAIGVETDFDGNFELTNIKEGDVLTFNFLGYINQDFIVKKNKTSIKIYMEEDSFILVGDVDTKTAYTTKRSFWNRVKSIF